MRPLTDEGDHWRCVMNVNVESSLKNAVLNQVNLILLAGAVLFALAVGSRLPLVLAAVVEVAW